MGFDWSELGCNMKVNFDDIESVRVIYEISCLIKSDEKLEDKFIKALEMVRDAVGCNSGSLFIYNEKDEILEEVATVGKRVELIETTQFDMGTGLSAWVAKKRDSVMLPDIRKNINGGFKSFISSPLVSEDKLIGVINIGHEKPNYFTKNHLKFIEIIAGELANTIERTKYEKELIEKNTALEIAKKEIEKQHEQIIEMEKNQVLAQIAASLNHEINNPLTSIIGNIELILMKGTGIDNVVEKKLRVIMSEGKRIQKIVERFRNIKQIVLKDYLSTSDEKIIDIDSSSGLNETENLS